MGKKLNRFGALAITFATVLSVAGCVITGPRDEPLAMDRDHVWNRANGYLLQAFESTGDLSPDSPLETSAALLGLSVTDYVPKTPRLLAVTGPRSINVLVEGQWNNDGGGFNNRNGRLYFCGAVTFDAVEHTTRWEGFSCSEVEVPSYWEEMPLPDGVHELPAS